jgi:farnesol dehydrogenase
MVHVSTVLTLPEIRARRHPSRAVTPYEATKLAGEDLVAAAAAEGFPAVIVHPTRVFGPGPLNDANGVTRLLALYLRGPVTLRLADQDVRANYVHAADVAQGIAHALTRGVPGAHYVLGSTELSVRELLDLAGDVAGHRHPVLAVPPRAAVALARASCLWGRLGGRALITPDWVWSYLEDHAIDLAPTISALGYHPLPFRERLGETIQWLRHSSLIAA